MKSIRLWVAVATAIALAGCSATKSRQESTPVSSKPSEVSDTPAKPLETKAPGLAVNPETPAPAAGDSEGKWVDDWKWEADLDGDGKLDTFYVTGGVMTELLLGVQNAAGKTLHDGKLSGKIQSLQVLAMPDGTRLVHLEVQGCANYPQNQFLAYSPATRQVTNPWEKGDSCAKWTYQGDGKFTTFYKDAYPIAGVTERRWEKGKFRDVKSARVLYDGVEAARVPALLNDLAGQTEEVQGTEYLFASQEIYRQFRSKTEAGGWSFQASAPIQGDTLNLTVKVREKAVGTAILKLKQKDDRKVVITEAAWPK